MGNEATPLVRGGSVASTRPDSEKTLAAAPAPGKQPLIGLSPDVPAKVAATANAPANSKGTALPAASDDGPSMRQARSLLRLCKARLLAIQTALLPAYQNAVVATDTAAVRILVQQLVGGVGHVIDGQAAIERLVPQVDRKATAANTSTPLTDPGAPDPQRLAAFIADTDALERDVHSLIGELTIKVSPQTFGILPTGALVPIVADRTFVHFVSEAALVVDLMEAADQIEELVAPRDLDAGTSHPATGTDQDQAAEHLSRWKMRPVNFYFIERVLKQRGVWAQLGGRSQRGESPADMERHVDEQAAIAGATADLGQWDQDTNELALGAGRMPVSGESAMEVLRRLFELDTDARAGAIKQLAQRGGLERLCNAIPWPLIKQLWETLPDPKASKLLEPYWMGKGDIRSLGKMLDGNMLTRALSKVMDYTTLGAKAQIDAAYDARAAGYISEDDLGRAGDSAVMRAAFIAAAMAATGGLAGSFMGGVATGAGLGAGAAVVADTAAAGAVGAVGGQLAGDVYDQAHGDKEGFDSFSSYARTFATGGLTALALAPLGLAAGRYLPAAMRTLAQQTAARFPKWTRVLDAARSAGVGVSASVRMSARELTDALHEGGPPGVRFAHAGGPSSVPPALASAASSASVVLTVRPLTDLNAPANAFRWGDDLLEVSLAEQIGDHFAEMGKLADEPHPVDSAGSLAGEESRLGEEGPEVSAVGARRTRRDAGMVSDEGGRITAQHHVFPQEHRAWFEARGIDIDDYCVVTPEVEHQAQHGGGSSRLARRVAETQPEAEWNAAVMKALKDAEALKRTATRNPRARLSAKEIIREGKKVMKSRKLGDLPFTRYEP